MVRRSVASRVESTLGKPEILELYLNSAYLGRGSWGVEMAARTYFGKSAKNLTLAEGAICSDAAITLLFQPVVDGPRVSARCRGA